MSLHLENKPDYDECVARLQAWFEGRVIDRAPVRFHRHNAQHEKAMADSGHATLRDRWMDAEFRANAFLDTVRNQRFNAETFPVYTPNLGPNWYAAVHGAEIEFGETTSWVHPIINNESDLPKIQFSRDNPYYKKMRELTDAALSICHGQFLVGYTDLHPGMDCAAAWRGTENLCIDLVADPDMARKLMRLATEHFQEIYDEWHTLLKNAGQPSVTWMNIPVPRGRMHIPSCDFSFMISPAQFDEFALPHLRNEIRTMTHNVYHIDGKGVANHTDSILGVAGIHAIQWVQGVGDDYPILQHLPYIKRLQSKRAPVIIDFDKRDLEALLSELRPEGVLLWTATDNEEQEHAIIKRLLKWK